MSLQVLLERAKILQNELQRAKQNVASTTEQLEQAKSHFSMVTGHLNEVGFLISLEQQGAQNNAVVDSLDDNSKEQEDVDTNKQEQEQTPQE
jgi:hypothetical protein